MWSGQSATTPTQVLATQPAEPIDNMPSLGSQSDEDGPASPNEANENEEDIETDVNAIFLCICGTGDPGDWVECCSRSCAVSWYHFKCVGLTKTPLGFWLCPDCRPTTAFNVDTRAPRKNSANTPLFPNLGREGPAALKKELPLKKGVAIKKVTHKKEKPRWKGWVEVSETEEEEFIKKVEEPWSALILSQRRRSNVKACGEQDAQPQKEAEADQEAEDKTETNEEPWSTRMLPQRRRSSAKTGAVDAQPQNQNETDNKAEDEAAYDAEQNAYDETEDGMELLSTESSDDDDVHEQSVFGNNTGSEFEGIADDEDTMDYTSVQDEQESTVVGIDTKSEGITDDEDSIDYTFVQAKQEPMPGGDTESEGSDDATDVDIPNSDEEEMTRPSLRFEDVSAPGFALNSSGGESSASASSVSQPIGEQDFTAVSQPTQTAPLISDSANYLLSAAGASVQWPLRPTTGLGAPSGDDSTGASASSEGAWVLQYRAGLTGRYPTLAERSTLPRLA